MTRNKTQNCCYLQPNMETVYSGKGHHDAVMPEYLLIWQAVNNSHCLTDGQTQIRRFCHMERVSMFVSPTCIHLYVCMLAMMSSLWYQLECCVRFLSKETGGHTLWHTRHGVSRAQREPYTVSATNAKATKLNYNHRATTASSAQYILATKRDPGWG